MEEGWFTDSAEKLQLTNDKFDYLVLRVHPTPDLITSPAFQKAGEQLVVDSCFVFSIVAYNTNPTSSSVTKVLSNFGAIQKRLCTIQSQLSDACTVSLAMELIFIEEALAKHPLNQLHIWKCMSATFLQISSKDSDRALYNCTC
eukprot:3799479-Rhodomonas_salina.2